MDIELETNLDEALAALSEQAQPRGSEEEETWKRYGELPASVRRQLERKEALMLRKRKRREGIASGKIKVKNRGRRHWKSKARTEERRRAKAWAERPFDCLLLRNPYAAKRLDRAVWDREAGPIWAREDPAMLSVKFKRGSGTRAEPWSMYTLKIIHKEKGTLLDGESLLLYDLGVKGRTLDQSLELAQPHSGYEQSSDPDVLG